MFIYATFSPTYSYFTTLLCQFKQTLVTLPRSAFAAAFAEASARRARARGSLKARFEVGWRETTERTYLWRRAEVFAAVGRALAPIDAIRLWAERIATVNATLSATSASGGRINGTGQLWERVKARGKELTKPFCADRRESRRASTATAAVRANNGDISSDDSGGDDDGAEGDVDHAGDSDDVDMMCEPAHDAAAAAAADAAVPVPERRELFLGIYGAQKLRRRLEIEAAEAEERVAVAAALAAAIASGEETDPSAAGAGGGGDREWQGWVDVPTPVTAAQALELQRKLGLWEGPDPSAGYACLP